jgi:hypothetical protein
MIKLLLMLAALVAGGSTDVDLQLRPAGCGDGEVYVDLVATADGGLPVMASAVNVIVESDLPFVRLETTPGMWMIADTLPDPDGINDDTADGQFLLTFLSSPAVPTIMQTCGTVVGTLVFDASDELEVIRLVRSAGNWAESAVYLYDTPNTDVLGSIRGVRVFCR